MPCAAALAHLRVRDQMQLDEHVLAAGERLRSGLQIFHEEAPEFFDAPRGSGLMLGLPVTSALNASSIVAAALDQRLLINAAGNNTLRFVPPLIISYDEIDEALKRLKTVVNGLLPLHSSDWRATPA